MKDDLDEKLELEFYRLAEKSLQTAAEGLRQQALLAMRWRRNPTAMRIFTALWGRRAGTLARAVVWWPQEFEETQDTRTYLTLFQLARLPYLQAQKLYAEWRGRADWEPWLVAKKVQRLRLKPRAAGTSVRLRAVVVTEVGQGCAELADLSHAEQETLVPGATYRATLTPKLNPEVNDAPKGKPKRKRGRVPGRGRGRTRV